MDVEKLLPYHSHLNPLVWDGFTIDSDIRNRLLEIAEKFKEFLDIENIKVYDIILTGSLANYNYTDKSDFDLHLVVDHNDIDGDLAEKFLQAKKTIWNDQHDIKIKGHEVELYAQDISEPHHSTGTYSLLKDRWLTKPKYQNPDINHLAVKIKSRSMMKQIDKIIADQNTNIAEVETLREKIRNMRRSGLQTKGEFSTENLTFKMLRNEGYLDKLWQYSNDLIDRELSMESMTETIRKIGTDKWRLYSKDGKKNLGTFDSLGAAKKHEREVQYFKHAHEDAAGVGIVTKQNTTKDVNKGTLKKMMKGYKLI
jgi:hypothetical protein